MAESEYIKKFSINSIMAELKICIDIACEVQNQFKFEPLKDFAFQTVLIESVTNAIVHGNKLNRDLPIFVTIIVDIDMIKIDVEDMGEGFDIEKVPSPIDNDRINMLGGRGIFFMRHLSSSLNTRGKGNIVEIIIDR